MTTSTATSPALALAEAERERRRRTTARLDAIGWASRIGITPDPWQVRVLTASSAITLICCARQIGKSTAVGLLLTRYLLIPDQTIAIFSPGGRQSKELLRRALRFWRLIGRPVEAVGVAKESMELVNGSRILALPGNPDTTVGLTPTLIVIEEAARTEDELFHAVTPMSGASGAPIVALTTPHGKRGWFHDLWHMDHADDPGIQRIMAKASDVPHRYQPGFLERQRRINPLYPEHYDCEFLDDERQAFASSDIAAAQVEMATWDFLLRESA